MAVTGVPPIKSQGIKTKLVPWIGQAMPETIAGRWIEPFMGTGVVGLNLAPRGAVLSDINPHLVAFYQALATGRLNPAAVRTYLEAEGGRLRDAGDSHYYYIRDRFNEAADPLDFLFVNRAGFNGMIRFNRKGGFNIPFCRKPDRFAPAYVTKIVNQTGWAARTIAERNLSFVCRDYITAIADAGADDVIYCDPPYIGRHVDYYSSWEDDDERRLFDALRTTPARFMLSTWHHNDFRANTYVSELWSVFHVATREHFYHVGAREANRRPMIEAIVTNYPLAPAPSPAIAGAARAELVEVS